MVLEPMSLAPNTGSRTSASRVYKRLRWTLKDTMRLIHQALLRRVWPSFRSRFAT